MLLKKRRFFLTFSCLTSCVLLRLPFVPVPSPQGRALDFSENGTFFRYFLFIAGKEKSTLQSAHFIL